MTASLKYKIIELRKLNKTYDEISKELGCSKATISYHCTRNNMGYFGLKISLNLIEEINNFYENNTLKSTANKFNVSTSTVIKYTKNKRKILSDVERKKRNYLKVKSFRQKIKEKAVEYKGGKCEKCGYDNCIWALEFHHKISKEKDFNISNSKMLNWEKIKLELDKCAMVCSNCHREIHHNIGSYRLIG